MLKFPASRNHSFRSTALETKHKQRPFPRAASHNIYCSEGFQAVTARPTAKREVLDDLHYRYSFSSYCAVNTLCLFYKNQSVNRQKN